MLGAQLNGSKTNSQLDSGAGCCLIDLGSLETVGAAGNISPISSNLYNASGEKMDICGVVTLEVKLRGIKTVNQEFKVLNSKSYSNILLGRDFMKRFGSIKLDFVKNRVKLGKNGFMELTFEMLEKTSDLLRKV